MKLIDHTLPSPAENLAADEALLDAAEAGGDEVVRFWESPDVFAVVGYANKVASEVNLSACEAAGVPILRRCSGGGTVLQGPGCLNYALVLRIVEDGPFETIGAANWTIMERNRTALDTLLQRIVEVRGHTDLTVDGLKFSGNSQRRRKHFLLFHGTFLLNFDLSLVSRYLPMPSKQPDYRNARSHADFVTNLNVSAETVKAALAATWHAKGASDVSLEDVGRLVAQKYGRQEWNFKF